MNERNVIELISYKITKVITIRNEYRIARPLCEITKLHYNNT